MEITLGKPKKEEGGQKKPVEPHNTSLFSNKKPDQSSNLIMQATSQINNLATRLKIMEDRYNNLRRKIQVLEENMLSNNRKKDVEIKTTNTIVTESNQTIEDMKQNLKLIISELKLSAKTEDVDVLKRYINLWEPLQYVTRNEFERIVEEIVDEKLHLSKKI